MLRKLNAAAISSVLFVTLAACSDGDKDDTTATSLDAASARARYCAIEASVDALFNAAFSGISGTPSDEVSAAVAADVIDQFGDEAIAAAPPEIADDVAVLVAATTKMAEGNPGAFNTFIEETQVAGDAVADFCSLP